MKDKSTITRLYCLKPKLNKPFGYGKGYDYGNGKGYGSPERFDYGYGYGYGSGGGYTIDTGSSYSND